MSRRNDRARIAYAPGEAWCIAAGRVVLVCERDLAPARAAVLHAQAAAVDSADALRALADAEPTALIALVDLDGSRALLRRHGVPATADDAPLPDRFGADWSLDTTGAAAPIAAGAIPALDDGTLPLEGGVVRVAAVRVEPRAADASAHDAEARPADADGQAARPSTGAFGQTLPPVGAEPAAEPVPTDTGNPIGGLIDSVPGFIRPAADVSAPSSAEPAVSADALAGAEPGPPSPEAPASPAPAPAAPAPLPPASQAPAHPAHAAAAALGDHDGMTVTADRARELLAERPQPAPAAAAAAVPATGPLVLSTQCANGHVNAPGTLRCFQCGAAIDEASVGQRRRPEVAVAVLPSGERVPLGRGVVIGRRPRSRRVEDGRVPRLVTVESPSEDISRSHLELRVEDWNLVAVDLSSTNGTLLLREGATPQRLRPEASTILQLGDRLDLGDGVVVTIEALLDGHGAAAPAAEGRAG